MSPQNDRDRQDMCACGEPLHYTRPDIEAAMRRLVAKRGELQKITVMGIGEWMVPRHYIALHGIKGSELPELAERLGFEQA